MTRLHQNTTIFNAVCCRKFVEISNIGGINGPNQTYFTLNQIDAATSVSPTWTFRNHEVVMKYFMQFWSINAGRPRNERRVTLALSEIFQLEKVASAKISWTNCERSQILGRDCEFVGDVDVHIELKDGIVSNGILVAAQLNNFGSGLEVTTCDELSRPVRCYHWEERWRKWTSVYDQVGTFSHVKVKKNETHPHVLNI